MGRRGGGGTPFSNQAGRINRRGRAIQIAAVAKRKAAAKSAAGYAAVAANRSQMRVIKPQARDVLEVSTVRPEITVRSKIRRTAVKCAARVPHARDRHANAGGTGYSGWRTHDPTSGSRSSAGNYCGGTTRRPRRAAPVLGRDHRRNRQKHHHTHRKY